MAVPHQLLDREWNELLQNELDNDRPIIYSGYNSQSGHAFILDGYTDTNYYSVNWGWSGYCNGYFLLTALDPEGQGIGGSDHYNDGQNAIVGIQPDAGNEPVTELRFFAATQEGINYNGITVEGNIAQGETVWIHAGGIGNFGSTAFSGRCQLAVTDREGQVIHSITQGRVDGYNPGAGFIMNAPFEINMTFLPGYRIRALYISDTGTDWSVVRGNEDEGCVWEYLLADEHTIEESTSLTYNKTEHMMRLRVKEGVTATLQTSDGTDCSASCNAEGQEIRIDTSTLPGGTYRLILQKETERKELLIALPDNE